MAVEEIAQAPHKFRRVVATVLGLLALSAIFLAVAVPTKPERIYPKRLPVRFWHMWTAEQKDVVDRIIDRFNQSQDRYEVIALSVPGGSADGKPGTAADTKFLMAVIGGDPPDCMAQWNAVISNWANNGLLRPLDELMSAAQRDRFEREAYPIAKKIGIYKDRLYGMTIGINVWACYYRLDHLREEGLDPDKFPETLEGLMEWGRKLHRYDKHGNFTRLGFFPGWNKFMTTYAPVFGGGFYDWQKGKVLIYTPENLRALTFLDEQVKKIGFKNIVRFYAGVNQGYTVEWPFINGAISIAIDGQWRVEQLRKYAPNLEYRVAPKPAAIGGKSLSGWSNSNFMVIPRGAKQPEGAWEFIKFWSGLENPERAAEFYIWGGWLPLSPNIAATPVYQAYLQKYPQFRKFLEILPSENMDTTPPVPYQVYLYDQITRTEDAIMHSALDPAQALSRLEENVHKELQRRKALGYAD